MGQARAHDPQMYCYGTLWVPYQQAPEHFMVELEGFFHSGFFLREALKWSCFKEVFQVTCDLSKKNRTH
jgi:hypothetical protein